MIKLFGIETEYGITREDLETMDPVIESMELVRTRLQGEFRQEWDYQGEDPHQDARGNRVMALSQDDEEKAFLKGIDATRPFTFYEMKSDLVLSNGARFYNDHTHPEFSTPECNRIKDLVIYDKAGEWILRQAAWKRNQNLKGGKVQLYKNNTDFHGHSYGCHDNYLLPRSIPFGLMAKQLIPFLVTRQIFAGAGKMGIETQQNGFEYGLYQISQRADFIETELSIETMKDRPIINTRDEPHADPALYRRLHLILGDANMSEFATALKVGTTVLVLTLIHQGKAPKIILENPVQTIRWVSRDPNLKQTLRCQNGKTLRAIDLQSEYLMAAQKNLSGKDPETDWVLSQWEEVLALLETDREKLKDRVDWITKEWLLNTFCDKEKISRTDPWLVSLDLEYHNLDPDRGLYAALETEGKMKRLTTDQDIQQALHFPPRGTRASIRGLCVRKFHDQIKSIQWEKICFKNGWQNPMLNMENLLDPEEINNLYDQLESASDWKEAATILNGLRVGSTQNI